VNGVPQELKFKLKIYIIFKEKPLIVINHIYVSAVLLDLSVLFPTRARYGYLQSVMIPDAV